jgi:hypothetical protein
VLWIGVWPSSRPAVCAVATCVARAEVAAAVRGMVKIPCCPREDRQAAPGAGNASGRDPPRPALAQLLMPSAVTACFRLPVVTHGYMLSGERNFLTARGHGQGPPKKATVADVALSARESSVIPHGPSTARTPRWSEMLKGPFRAIRSGHETSAWERTSAFQV